MTGRLTDERLTRAGLFIIALLAVAAYARAMTAPFVFDDRSNVLENESIRNLWPPWNALWAAPGVGNAGRPLVNLTNALNYAAGGLDPAGYHLVNLAIHLLGGFVFFALARRSFALARFRGALPPNPGGAPPGDLAATAAALFAAGVFTLHPLATESVTYVTQRSEEMMLLFLLLCLLFAVKGWETGKSRPWHALSAAAMLAGAASKETMIAAPVLVLLWDRLFVRDRFFDCLRRSPLLYSGLLAGLLFLGLLTVSGKTLAAAPLSTTLSPLSYAAVQAVMGWRVVRLFLLPLGLCFDAHGMPRPETWRIALAVACWLPVFAAVGLGLRRGSPAGFWGAFFFLLLAPSSSFLPLADLFFEHRAYGALAALSALSALAGLFLYERLKAAGRWDARARRALGAAVILVFLLLTGATFARNGVYASPVALWSDTVRKAPYNPRAHLNLGVALRDTDRIDQEILAYQEALALKPDYPDALHNLAHALTRAGRYQEALDLYNRAVKSSPLDADSINGRGVVLAILGKREEAIADYRRALAIAPGNVMALANLGKALFESGRSDEARRCFEDALRIAPDFFPAHAGLGDILDAAGDLNGAALQYSLTLSGGHEFPDVRFKLAVILGKLGRPQDAIENYRRAVAFDPNFFEAFYNLGNALIREGRIKEAIDCLDRAVALRPDSEKARQNLDIARRMLEARH